MTLLKKIFIAVCLLFIAFRIIWFLYSGDERVSSLVFGCLSTVFIIASILLSKKENEKEN